MQTQLKEIIVPVLELLNTAKQGVDYCHSKILEEEVDDSFYQTLQDIEQAVLVVKNFITPYISILRTNQLLALCDNISYSINDFAGKDFHDLPYPQFTYENEIKAAVYGLYEALKFAFIIAPDPAELKKYLKKRENLCLLARELDVTQELAKIQNQYEVNIVIMTYNLLDYFKQCLESILQYTEVEKHKVQIIVFDHGSTDGTPEYLEQFKHLNFLKVHHCKENIKNELTFVTKNSNWYDTKYTMIIANDTIATENYLENLLACIKSDDRIAWICPSMSNTSNFQSIPTEYETIEEMHEFAKRHNHSDPTKWVELYRLIPVFSMYNNVCRKSIDHEDPRYYDFFFGDDDISRSFVRAKYRLLVCKDTYIHHYPSMTVHNDSRLDEKYYLMRKVFFEKLGYDAWEYQTSSHYFEKYIELSHTDTNVILFVEPAMGEGIQALRTRLHQEGLPLDTVEIHSVSNRIVYKLDMGGYSAQVNVVDDYKQLGNIYDPEVFDAIVISDWLDDLDIADYKKLFVLLKQLLKRGGKIYCGFRNCYYQKNIYHMLTLQFNRPHGEFDSHNGKFTRMVIPNDFNKTILGIGYQKADYTLFKGNEVPQEDQEKMSLIDDLQKKLGIEEGTEQLSGEFYMAIITK